MLARVFQVSGPCGVFDRKVLVLATGALTESIRSSLLAFLKDNWRVELHSFQRCWQPELEQMKMAFASRFQVVPLDEKLETFVVNRQSCEPTQQRHSIESPVPPLTAMPAITHSHVEPPPVNVFPDNWRRPAASGASITLQTWRNQRSAAVSSVVAAKDWANAQKNRRALAALPVKPMPTDNPRVVLLDVDDITESLFSSEHLFAGIPGATKTRDLRLNFQALTSLVCGHNESLVYDQLAVFATTNPILTRLLPRLGWKSTSWKHVKVSIPGYSTLQRKTLVIISGNHYKLRVDSETVSNFIGECLRSGWHVEIYSWLHTLDEDMIELQRAHPEELVVRPLDDALQKIVYSVVPFATNKPGVGVRPAERYCTGG